MRKAVCVLMPLLMLTGCGTIGNVFSKTGQILMDPSIQVGANEDQPTLVGLSLYAAPDVNPNAQHLEPDLDTSADSDLIGKHGSYAVHFVSDNKQELINNLYLLLEHLRSDAAPEAFVAEPSAARQPVRQATDQSHAQYAAGPLESAGDGMDETQTDHTQKSANPELGQYDANGQRRSFAPPQVDSSVATVPGSPIAFKLVQLKDDSLLLNADPDQLRKDLKKTLGSTYLEADDYLLVPGQFKYVPFSAIRDDTRFLAVIADFHDANAIAWKQVVPLEPRGHKYSLLVTLSGTRVSITDESKPALPSWTAQRSCPSPPVPRRFPPVKQPSVGDVQQLPADLSPALSDLLPVRVTP